MTGRRSLLVAHGQNVGDIIDILDAVSGGEFPAEQHEVTILHTLDSLLTHTFIHSFLLFTQVKAEADQ